MLQLDRHTIYELIRQNKIPAFRAGRVIRIHRDKLLEIVAKGGAGNEPHLEGNPWVGKRHQ